MRKVYENYGYAVYSSPDIFEDERIYDLYDQNMNHVSSSNCFEDLKEWILDQESPLVKKYVDLYVRQHPQGYEDEATFAQRGMISKLRSILMIPDSIEEFPRTKGEAGMMIRELERRVKTERHEPKRAVPSTDF